jgi:hypothetical protein
MKNERFPQFLKFLLDTEHYTLGDLAVSSKVHVSDLSKIVGGKRKCGPRLVGHIVDGLKPGDRADALVNWIEDQVPPRFSDLVTVSKNSQVDESVDPVALPIDNALILLGKEARTNEAVRNLLLSMAGMFEKP